ENTLGNLARPAYFTSGRGAEGDDWMQNENVAEGGQGEAEAPRFIQYIFFKADPLSRRMPKEERTRGRR
ncbi:MAG TPA: hypothetical protein VFG99_11915, partial [Chloroflexia bacterium]|nr:hypothetical protein [Chloroflexia bacterium]